MDPDIDLNFELELTSTPDLGFASYPVLYKAGLSSGSSGFAFAWQMYEGSVHSALAS